VFVRPCFLVVDREFAGSISSRKLVLETGKFNVITAYSFAEGRILLDRFPLVDGIVLTADREGQAEQFMLWVRSNHARQKVIVTGLVEVREGLADRHIEGFAPDKLLKTLRELVPDDAKAADDIESQLEADAGER
jgi:hypothetical protein